MVVKHIHYEMHKRIMYGIIPNMKYRDGGGISEVIIDTSVLQEMFENVIQSHYVNEETYLWIFQTYHCVPW